MDVDEILFQVFGITYLVAWTSVYYPQIILNAKTKSFRGLSAGFVFYNTWGFFCYTVYNVTRTVVQSEYGLPKAVSTHDVLFASHAFICCLALCTQLYCFRDPTAQLVTLFDKIVLFVLILIPTIAFLLSVLGVIDWFTTNGFACADCSFLHQFTFVQVLGYIKIFVTVVKYPAQIRLNHARKSTVGLSFTTYILDTMGAGCSLAQNLSHAILMKDMEYIIGNIPKIGLGSISLVYCLVIIGQMCYYGRSKQPYIKIGVDDTVAQDTVIKVYAQTVGKKIKSVCGGDKSKKVKPDDNEKSKSTNGKKEKTEEVELVIRNSGTASISRGDWNPPPKASPRFNLSKMPFSFQKPNSVDYPTIQV